MQRRKLQQPGLKDKTMKRGFITSVAIFILTLMAHLPFGVIYFLSDVLFFAMFYLFQYRKKVVFRNLKYAFPNKSGTEIKAIAKQFYRHFCDISLETIKMSRMNTADFAKRVTITNPEFLNGYAYKGQSVVVLTMHYNNWEWGIYMSKLLKHKILAVYKPLHNQHFDRHMNEIRSKFGTELVPDNQLLRRLIIAEKQHEPVAIWLAGDQTPPWNYKSWYRFLNQDALFYEGPAAISKKYMMPVLFQRIEKTGRGHYAISIELLFENTVVLSDSEIINSYISKLESIISQKPAYYLWSHKRWKHKRPADMPLRNQNI